MSNVSAIIIARGGSRRFPNKNLALFHGRSLVGHKVHQLKQVPEIKRVYVGSDDPAILAEAERYGGIAVGRDPKYCDEVSKSWNEVIVDMANKVEGNTIVWAHCTNPCILPQTYSRAVDRYFTDEGDSLIGVAKLRSHYWFKGQPLNFNPWSPEHQVAAALEPVYHQHGGLFIYDRAAMIKDRYVYGHEPILHEIDPDEAIDIDYETDFERARLLYPWIRERDR